MAWRGVAAGSPGRITDNGAETFTWPDGGTTMFRGEKNTPWEGGRRVPAMIKWPGVIEPGTVVNDIGAHEDMLPTLVAAADKPNAAADLLKGKAMGCQRWQWSTCSPSRRPAPTSATGCRASASFRRAGKPGSFNLDRVMEAVTKGAGDK